MTHSVDNALRIGLIAIGLVAIGLSFAFGAAEGVDRANRFVGLTALGWIVASSVAGLEIVEDYPQRRPLLSAWGRPRAGSATPIAAPQPSSPQSEIVAAALRPASAAGVLAVSVVVAGAAATIGFALASEPITHGGLFVFVVLGAAVRFGSGAVMRLLTRAAALRVDTQRARLGASAGYLPPVHLLRSDVAALELSEEPRRLAFVTAHRRFDVALSALSNPNTVNEIAAVWPEMPWHELPPDAA